MLRATLPTMDLKPIMPPNPSNPDFTAPPSSSLMPPGVIPTGLGLDLVHLPRLSKLYKIYGERFLDRVLTPNEKRYVLSSKSEKMQLARAGGRVAVKEAV